MTTRNKYCGETRAPAEGPRMGSKIKEPRGGAGMREAMSLHKRGGQPQEDGSPRQKKMMGGKLGRSVTINEDRAMHKFGGVSASRLFSNLTRKSGLGTAAKYIAKAGKAVILPAMSMMPGPADALASMGSKALENVDLKKGGKVHRSKRAMGGLLGGMQRPQLPMTPEAQGKLDAYRARGGVKAGEASFMPGYVPPPAARTTSAFKKGGNTKRQRHAAGAVAKIRLGQYKNTRN